MEISFNTSGFPETMRKLQAVEDFLNDPAPMQGLVDEGKAWIIDKTARGLDYTGRRFDPYSDSYKERRKKMGLGTKPDLRVTGEMLDSIEAKAESHDKGIIRVTAKKLIAWFHTRGGPKPGHPPMREFMNITKNRILVLAKKWFNDPLMKILGRR